MLHVGTRSRSVEGGYVPGCWCSLSVLVLSDRKQKANGSDQPIPPSGASHMHGTCFFTYHPVTAIAVGESDLESLGQAHERSEHCESSGDLHRVEQSVSMMM